MYTDAEKTEINNTIGAIATATLEHLGTKYKGASESLRYQMAMRHIEYIRRNKMDYSSEDVRDAVAAQMFLGFSFVFDGPPENHLRKMIPASIP